MQETIELFFSPSKEETFDNYHCSSSEHGNLNFLECHFDAPSDYQMQETYIVFAMKRKSVLWSGKYSFLPFILIYLSPLPVLEHTAHALTVM